MKGDEAAERARRQHGERLRRFGAHSIIVKELRDRNTGKRTWALLTLYEGEAKSRPDFVDVLTDEGKVRVKVHWKRESRMKLE